MFHVNFKIIHWLVLSIFISLVLADLNRRLFFDFAYDDDRKACMETYNITEEIYNEMKEATKHKDEYSCLIGCIMMQKHFIQENGILNDALVEIAWKNSLNLETKPKHRAVINKLKVDFGKPADVCKAGKIGSTFLYSVEEFAEIFKNVDDYETFQG
ncbi:uncharacterized protein LOC116343600 [Contarinia nasturtii]|uniref:uncharacterized protein LOC116343600 n=1 Tax=Contarinia nasturtii TaxID=265458 RepID=UPI0012D3D66A|nr:uncharacterized protein LOC116343600 [Contarinia nasturtii]